MQPKQEPPIGRLFFFMLPIRTAVIPHKQKGAPLRVRLF